MGNRSKQHDYALTWKPATRKRADADHARKKAARRQQQHLLRIKTAAQLRVMVLAGKVKQKK